MKENKLYSMDNSDENIISDDKRKENDEKEKEFEKKKGNFWNEFLLPLFGKIFRPIFYIGLGLWGYYLINDNQIGDVPFSQLTFRMIFLSLFGIGIIIFSFRQLFNPPDNKEGWTTWGGFVILILIGLGLFYYFFVR